MDKNLKRLLMYAGAIKLYEIWVFYLYLRDTWEQTPLPENASTYYSHNHYFLFLLIAEVAFFYILVRFKVRTPGRLGLRIAQAGAIAVYLPFIYANKDIIPYFSISYAIAFSLVCIMFIYLQISNSRKAWKFVESFAPKARALRSR